MSDQFVKGQSQWFQLVTLFTSKCKGKQLYAGNKQYKPTMLAYDIITEHAASVHTSCHMTRLIRHDPEQSEGPP